MSWTDDLANGVRQALQRKQACKVLVHSDAQAELGKSAAARMAPQFDSNADLITFEVITEREREIYPVGSIST